MRCSTCSTSVAPPRRSLPPRPPAPAAAVVPRGATPAPPSTVFSYVGGANHVPAGGRTDGTVTLSAASANKPSQWPLAQGRWVAWFLVDDGFTTVASVEFTVL